jgi:hypothetical protein
MQPSRLQSLADADIGYVVLRQLGGILDELSVQGLTLWMDERNGWWWGWRGTNLAATHRFWALGEAFMDAVIARYPGAFGGQWPTSDLTDWDEAA